jgi:RimJ/RimL family protein N-acetyltransferase
VLTFARTRDYELVRRVLTHESQLRMSSEDATDVATWSPQRDDRVWYIAVRAYGKLYGIFTLIPQNAVCYEIHAALLPGGWGVNTRPALIGVIAWMFRHSPARRIVASIPIYNRLAIKLARDAGMQQFGTNPASFQRGGVLHDQELFGISKP